MNTVEQRIAYLNAQTACMLAELEGMKAANVQRLDQGMTIAYGEEAFFDLPAKFHLGHNAVIEFLREA